MNVFVADMFQGQAAILSCNGALNVAPSASATCDYALYGLVKEDGTNVATVTFNGYDFTGSAPVTFGDADVTEYDTCVDVTDSHFVDPLGTVCLGDAPATFSYPLVFSDQYDADVVVECGYNTHENVASFETNDTHTTGSSSWTVNTELACDTGCTLTPGYWKTHAPGYSKHEDDGWAVVVGGPDANFFNSGMTYYEILWAPVKGDPYLILGKAYIAAKLNTANGASSTWDEDLALWSAEVFLITDAAPGDGKYKKPVKAGLIELATLLDDYNNGFIGPGHCSE